jgi:hypothetical protein
MQVGLRNGWDSPLINTGNSTTLEWLASVSYSRPFWVLSICKNTVIISTRIFLNDILQLLGYPCA